MRYAIAHPERLVREATRRAMSTRPNAQLVWMAGSRAEIMPSLSRESVDLLLLDVSLAGADGEEVKLVRTQSQCAVLLFANDPDAAVGVIYEALGHGALAVTYPPSLSETGELVGSSQLLARLDRFASLVRPSHAAAPVARSHKHHPGRMLALGASTGGPNALLKVLQSLPAPFPGPIVLVQHIESEFLDGFASWLAKQSAHHVSLAKRGEVPEPGKVYLADGAGHLVLLPNGQFTYLSAHPSDLHVPSVNMLFSSLAENGAKGVAAILTGMGEDGAAGLLNMRQQGWLTVAQDQASCAVFGMPRAAIQLNAAMRIIELDGMGSALMRYFNQDF